MRKRWLVIGVICIGFILIQSAVPENKSAKESLWFTEQLLNPLLGRFGIVAEKDVVRKIAHTVEFGFLSLAAFFIWRAREKRVGYQILKTVYTGFTLAFLDESLQILTKRGALVKDIRIDLIGVVIGTAIAWLATSISTLQNKPR